MTRVGIGGLLVLILMPLAALSSYLITGLARRHAISHALLDVPNHRSSHTVPTPRGGGLGVAIVCLVGILTAWLLGAITDRVAIAFGGGGILVAAIGWADDRRSQSAGVRLAAQLAAATWAVMWLGGLPAITIGDSRIILGPAGAVLAVLGIMWSTNLYNFMDGIDGIAAVEAVCVGTIGGALLWLTSHSGLSVIAFIMVAGSLGFIPWNWPPAKIFMGDVGSSLLGFSFAALAIASENSGALPIIWWLLLLLVFVFDATTTLFRRGVARKRLSSAHREHAYQRAVALGFRHVQVTCGVLAINIALGVLAVAGFLNQSLAPFMLLSSLFLVAALYLLIERRMPMRKETGRF